MSTATPIQPAPTAPLPPAAVEAAADYRTAEARANELIRSAQAAPMSDLDADDLAHNVDLMAGYRATLAKAGRLDLIGAA